MLHLYLPPVVRQLLQLSEHISVFILGVRSTRADAIILV